MCVCVRRSGGGVGTSAYEGSLTSVMIGTEEGGVVTGTSHQRE